MFVKFVPLLRFSSLLHRDSWHLFYAYWIFFNAMCFKSSANIARGKPTKQSSTMAGGLSSRAVDGNANGAWAAKSFALTRIQTNPWWRIDLRNPLVKITLVKITGMKGCLTANKKRVCPASLLEVRIGNVDNNPKANAL